MNPQTHPLAIIKHKVGQAYGVAPVDLTSGRRAADVALARHVAMYLARSLTTASLPMIGRHFGGRDHTTVQHGVNRIAKLMQDDAAVDNEVARLRRDLERTLADPNYEPEISERIEESLTALETELRASIGQTFEVLRREAMFRPVALLERLAALSEACGDQPDAPAPLFERPRQPAGGDR